jgi:hypothetical protein
VVLQIHDELLLEVRRDALPAVARAVRACMQGVAALAVPLAARLSAGPRWGALAPYEPPLAPAAAPVAGDREGQGGAAQRVAAAPAVDHAGVLAGNRAAVDAAGDVVMADARV